MVLVLGDAGDTHCDRRSSLEQDRSGKVFWGRLLREVSNGVDLGAELALQLETSEALLREGLHLNNNKTTFFFSGDTQVVLVQSLGMVFSVRVSNPSLYCRFFWFVAGSDKHACR